MSAEQLALLRTPEGSAALAAAAELAGGDPVRSAPALRAQGFEPALATAALTQAELRRRAAGKFGADAAAMFFTRAGLEQATRAEVARRRAERLRSAGVGTLADLGCGVGADSIACARAGLRVYAVERDPATAAVAAANVVALGLASSISVACGDATEADLSAVDAVFCDPARRSGTGRRVFTPTAYEPPWDFVAGLAHRVPRTVLKLAPGIDHALIPPGAEAEWVSIGGNVVEATFWCGPLATVARRATVDGSSLTGSGQATAPVGPVGRYVYDPDGAVVRAHLVAELATLVTGVLGDPTIAYVYASTPTPTPYGRCFAVDDALPWSLKRLRAALRDRGVGRVEIRKRGSAVEPEWLRRQLRLDGPASATVFLTRVAGAPTALIATPVSGP